MRRTSSNSSRIKRQAGFSLIETLTVLGIIAILATLALPQIMTYLRTYRIMSAANEVAGEIQAARLKAISKNANKGVVFIVLGPGVPGNPRNQVGYLIMQEDNINGGTGARQTTTALLGTPAQLGPLHVLPNRIVFAAPAGFANNDHGLRFNRLGAMCDPGSAVPEPCPDLNDGGAQYLYIDPAGGANPGQATVSLTEVGTAPPLKVAVNVMPGGRVQFVKSWQP